MKVEELIYIDKNAFDSWYDELTTYLNSVPYSCLSWEDNQEPEFPNEPCIGLLYVKSSCYDVLESKPDIACFTSKKTECKIQVQAQELQELKKHMPMIPDDSYCDGEIVFWSEGESSRKYTFYFRKGFK